ncbi:MAG: transposase [Kiritimatiellaeota bacterium]|nr:transposase [Kiritimatiellota bacterium]
MAVFCATIHSEFVGSGTRANRAYLKSEGIRFSGKPLGCPRKETDVNKLELKEKRAQARRDEMDRIPVEGEFGQGKRKYGLDATGNGKSEPPIGGVSFKIRPLWMICEQVFFRNFHKMFEHIAKRGVFGENALLFRFSKEKTPNWDVSSSPRPSDP